QSGCGTARKSWSWRVILLSVDSVAVQTILRALRVGRESLASRQCRRNAPQLLRPGTRNRNHAGTLLEIVYAERRREARAPRGGQHMVGSRAVIADRLGAIVAEKNGAGIADLREQGLRVSDGKLKVLRRNAIADCARLFEVTHKNQRAPLGERLGDDSAPRLQRKLTLDACGNGIDERGIGREQHRARGLVVLGLSEE